MADDLREPREDERRRIEFYCIRIGRAIQSAPYYLALTALRLVVAMLIERVRPEQRIAILNDFCSELRSDVRRSMP